MPTRPEDHAGSGVDQPDPKTLLEKLSDGVKAAIPKKGAAAETAAAGIAGPMPRPLKVFRTHLGFYDLVVAAPSMKAAAEAWGAKPTLFSQGLAALTNDADAVQAALACPGTVLKRVHGQAGAYKLEPDAIAMPKLTPGQKQAARQSAAAHQRRAAEEKKAQDAAARKARKKAQDELAEIERAEAKLRNRRQALQKKFHVRSVK